jgi:Arc/MetJ family transcription regulator
LIRWIESDTLLRTEDELLTEAVRELGFKKRGSKIRAALTEAIRQTRKLG